jgi:hypothetical protein
MIKTKRENKFRVADETTENCPLHSTLTAELRQATTVQQWQRQ